MEKRMHRFKNKVNKINLERIPIVVVEKRIIMSFFDSIPIEDLKKLVSFETIDFKDEKLWGDSREDTFLYEKLCQLRNENVVEFNCEIKI